MFTPVKGKTLACQRERGFTLIELMVVIAIIGIVAQLGIPAYKSYILKSETSSAMKELGVTKQLAEVAIQRGITPSTDPTEQGYIGSHSAIAHYCDLSVSSSGTDTVITCTLKNVDVSFVSAGATLKLQRDGISGYWRCIATNMHVRYFPANCVPS